MTLSVSNLSFAYEESLILEGINFTVKEGEFICLFGPNGGGKTTLLKILLGLLQPTSGTVHLMGTFPEKVRTKIGYVPQAKPFDRLFPINTLEVVLQGLLAEHPYFFPKHAKEKARHFLKQVGLAHKEKAAFGTLSGGETQRTLLARALVCDPKILVLDEVTAGVDPKAQEQIYQHLMHLKQTRTILMVTHDLQTAVARADRFFCIHREFNEYASRQVCEHFALGLYHVPLQEKKQDDSSSHH